MTQPTGNSNPIPILSNGEAKHRSKIWPSTACLLLFIHTETGTVQVVQRLDGGGLGGPMPFRWVDVITVCLH